MLLPRMLTPVALLAIETPEVNVPPLPLNATTLPSPADVPPTKALVIPETYIPLSKLPKSSVPVKSVPMRLP